MFFCFAVQVELVEQGDETEQHGERHSTMKPFHIVCSDEDT